MSTKYEKISKLYDETLRQISENGENWKEFLRTAGRIYKYPFNEQVLIFAQRPDAIACASMNIWNNNMRCWVKRGSKGIALLDNDNERKNKLKYVFDVQDIYKLDKLSKLPYHWIYRKEHEESIVNRFSDVFGNDYNGSDLVEAVISLSEYLVDDSIDDIIEDLSVGMSDSKLAAESIDDVRNIVRKELSSTVAYTILSRCGVDTESYSDYFEFDNINLFDTDATLLVLGDYNNQISEDVLLTITNVIKNYNREKNISENAIENVENINYNEFSTLKRESDSEIGQNERSETNENRVYQERRLSDSEYRTGSGAGGNIDEVGTNEENLHDGEPQSDLLELASERNSEDEIARNTEESRGNVREPSESNDETREHNRGIESQGSDEVGSGIEQHQSESRGDSEDGINFSGSVDNDGQLTLFPSFEEQSGNVFMAVANDNNINATAFSLEKNDELYNQIIRHYPVFSGYEFENKKYTFYQLALMGVPAESLAKRVKREYMGHKIGFLNKDNEKMSLVYDDLCLSVAKGTSVYKASPDNEIDITYQEIAESIIELVKKGEYLSNEDSLISKDKYIREFAENISFVVRDLDDDFVLPEFLKEVSWVYPAATDFFEKLVLDPSKRKELITFFERDDLSFRFNRNKVSQVSNIINELKLIDNAVMLETSPIDDEKITEIGSFYITEDTIDALIIPSHVETRAKIYEAYLDDDKKNIQNLLKEHYGESGSAVSSVHANFTRGKGLEVDQGHILNPFDKVKFSWSAITKRVVNIIKEAPDDFISKSEMHEYLIDKKLNAITEENQDIINEIGKLEDDLSLFNKDLGRTTVPKHKNDLPNMRTYKATTEVLNSEGREKEHFEGVLRVIKENIEKLENQEEAWYEIDDYFINIFRDSNYDWQFTLFDKTGKEIDGGACTDQELRIDKAVINCMGLSGFVDYEPNYIIPCEEPTFNNDLTDKKEDTVTVSSEDLEPTISDDEEIEVLSEEEVEVLDNIEAKNYVIKNNELGFGTQKEKYQGNITAIRLLKKLESENRNATPEEQDILSKYVGWGGLADVFDEKKAFWTKEYKELKEVLTDAEYESAKGSVLNAHYTSPIIIKSMYDALSKMGFNKGNILEPSMGVGNFFGCMPENMNNSNLYGVELDDLSGRLAKKLYPKANIQIRGYEETDFSNDFFDVAIGNIPFGNYHVADSEFKNSNFMIHDYFFAKTLNKVRVGGIVAFVTSKGTMDKKSSTVREYLAERADLIGAIRLPNNAFKSNAGTEVTSDIIFLKKRETPSIRKPSWVNASQVGDMTLNNYFIEHPEMVLGKMEMVSGRFGLESACLPTGDLSEQLEKAIETIAKNGFYEEVDTFDMSIDEEFDDMVISAIPEATNFGHCVVDGNVYYRENSIMKLIDLTDSQKERMKALIEIRDTAYEVLNWQLEDFPEEQIKSKQEELNVLYDRFFDKYGRIASAPNAKTSANEKIFKDDYGLPLLLSLENYDENGKFLSKSAIFSERTIQKQVVPNKVDTSSEALALSINEKGKVDMDYMMELTEKSSEKIEKDLEGIIFINPLTDEYESSDEYLSGNVREKLKIAEEYAKNNEKFLSNVEYLKNVQPERLEASDIEIRLGSTWIEPEIIEKFMCEVLKTPRSYLYSSMGVEYSKHSDTWYVKGKSYDWNNPVTNFTYGTSRVNAYKILEETLNLKDVRVYDKVEEDGKEKRVLNNQETAIAQQKQDMLKEAFAEWIFKDVERRNMLVDRYNVMFNSIRPREYDGSALTFSGMSLDITLKDYQKNAVARMLFGGNTLLAHCVGAGKTFEMTTAAMESKRLGLCNKSLFVVPNHLTEQWGADFLRLYPTAKILVATKKDFTPLNRKRFASKIATGDYDAIIIGHTQFEKIPLSIERQVQTIETEIEEITEAINGSPAWERNSYSVKQMEKTKKNLEAKLKKLTDTKKDDAVTFEQLGVDRLFVDESHYYKNLFLYTKMRNVSGVTSSEAKKSTDMYSKIRYIDEITGGKGVTFATGTPISNTLSEMYTNMKYLQNNILNQMNLKSFDAWASAFAEPKTEMELAPEGTGYKLKTRLARFYNLPELVNVFKECADIQTPDMLNLPVPKANFEDIVLEPSSFQKEMIKSFAERAERVRGGSVDPKEDNMLKITNDGRYLALDERMINPEMPDDGNNKATACANKAFEIWEETKDKSSTQLIFSDISTPKGDGSFSIYEDIRDKLIDKGVPPEEIAFIHDANTEKRKSDLFAKVRSGQVRFLFGSTQKLGAGTNVQDKLIALHHLDVPWRPADIEQQEGRIIRRGNENDEVKIFRYIKKGTFDSYSWQLIEKKQRFISQIMTSKLPMRSADDIDEATLSYAEVKALATDNPLIKEKMELDNDLQKLKLARSNYKKQKYGLENDITFTFPKQKKALEEHIAGLEQDAQISTQYEDIDEESFVITIDDTLYADKKEGAEALLKAIKSNGNGTNFDSIAYYKDFEILVSFDTFSKLKVIKVKGAREYQFNASDKALGNLQRIDNAIAKIPKELEDARKRYDELLLKIEDAKREVEKPFPQEQEYLSKTNRLKQLEIELDLDAQNNEISSEEEENAMTDDEKIEKINENVEEVKEKVEEIKTQWNKTVEIQELDDNSVYKYNAKVRTTNGEVNWYVGNGLYFETLDEAKLYKAFIENGYGRLVQSKADFDRLYNLLLDDTKSFKVDIVSNDTSLGDYKAEIRVSDNGVIFENTDLESCFFKSQEEADKFATFIEESEWVRAVDLPEEPEFKKELVSEV